MKAAIKSIKTCLASGRLTNEQLAEEFEDWAVDKIYAKTGISTRGIAGPDECASDLGVSAVRLLFEHGACSAQDIDFLLFCTQSPDYFVPTTACIMQSRLGLRTTCGALDLNLGCSGYVYGLSLAKGLIETGQAANVLLVTAETYSMEYYGNTVSSTIPMALEHVLDEGRLRGWPWITRSQTWACPECTSTCSRRTSAQ